MAPRHYSIRHVIACRQRGPSPGDIIHMWLARIGAAAIVICQLSLAGCGTPEPLQSVESSPVSIDGANYLLEQEPANVSGVIAMMGSAADEEQVAVVGRIGGSAMPWVEGRAAFSIVDLSLKSCLECDSEGCPKPWDFCCSGSEQLASSTALIKVVDDDGNLLKVDARKLLPVSELSTVVVAGTARRDDAGNLTVLAEGLFVRE